MKRLFRRVRRFIYLNEREVAFLGFASPWHYALGYGWREIKDLEQGFDSRR